MLKRLIEIWRWIYVKIFSRIFYDKVYLKGRFFSEGIDAEGWKWAYQDIRYRFRSLHHLNIRWPISPNNEIGGTIVFDPDDVIIMNGMGQYYQALNGKIVIGKGTRIANNVGIITTNHDIYDIESHVEGKDVIIGRNCWIGINSVILPGVVLGDHTIVGGGSIVTHSFEEGNCVIAGNPAKKIRSIADEK